MNVESPRPHFKVLFISLAQAERAIKRAQRSHNPRRQECRAYFCAECHGWHLTSNPFSDPRRVTSVQRLRLELDLEERTREAWLPINPA